MALPGKICDRKGYPIYPGDILKTYHFTSYLRRKKNYLYHMVIQAECKIPFRSTDKMFVACFEYKNDTPKIVRMTTIESLGWHNEDNCQLEQSEIVQGYGPDKILSYDERKKLI